jgi:hypothetical protein
LGEMSSRPNGKPVESIMIFQARAFLSGCKV